MAEDSLFPDENQENQNEKQETPVSDIDPRYSGGVPQPETKTVDENVDVSHSNPDFLLDPREGGPYSDFGDAVRREKQNALSMNRDFDPKNVYAAIGVSPE